MENIFNKFTSHCIEALKSAFVLAKNLKYKTIKPEHLLYGISKETGSLGCEILNKVNLTPEKIKNQLDKKTSKRAVESINLSAASQKSIEKATIIAHLKNHRYIGTEHLLYGILETDKTQRLLGLFKINSQELKSQLKIVMHSTSKFPELINALDSFRNQDNLMPFGPKMVKRVSILDHYGTNLTDEKIQSSIDPLIGREEEISRLIQILSRRTKNNPLLLGDPGVGKTAIVEGLAKKIILREVPDILLNKKIYTLDMGLIVAGTSFRGEFENRLKQIIHEVKKNPNIILFIDEINNIIGAGSATGSMDAANILKPSLARGEIRCIGATTLEDYKKYIENDLALERRFQPIIINQPSIEKTIDILKGIRENYEKYHQVTITDDAIIAAAKLSHRYLQEKFLPDKAIDLIDEAASAFKIKKKSSGNLKIINSLENEIRELNNLKQKAVINEDFDLALSYRQDEEILLEKLKKCKEKERQEKRVKLGEIKKEHIVEIISKITQIPAKELATKEKMGLLNLEKQIARKIIGQNEAVKSVCEFIIRSRAGIMDTDRPIGSFIFLGPSGVGKTELAKILAMSVFGGIENLVRIDMSEFSESFNISKLIGSPAGYVGYKEGAKLTDAVKKKPYSIILFDEIEKAHPQVFNLLLQILEDGQLTDATGRLINFRNTIIVMTSNIGSEKFSEHAVIGFESVNSAIEIDQRFEEIKIDVEKKLRDQFRPEFLNRVDKVIIFKPLNLIATKKIVRLHINQLNLRLFEKNITLISSNSAINYLAKISYSPNQGARAVRKNVLELLETPIAKIILEENIAKPTLLKASLKKGKIDICKSNN